MVAAAERIESQFLQKAIGAGVAGDLNGMGSQGQESDFAYDGDPRDLEGLLGPSTEEQETMGEMPQDEGTREIEGSRDAAEVKLRFKDGSLWEGTIPALTMTRLDLLSVHQTQVQAAERRLTAAAERGDPKAIAKNRQDAYNAKRAMFRFALPTFPDARYPELLASAYVSVINRLDSMQDEMLQPQRGSGPNR